MGNKIDIANRLRKARINAGFASAREAADSLGIDYPTYAAHENGSRGLVRTGDLYARRFRVSLDWLLRGVGSGPVAPNSKETVVSTVDHVSSEKHVPNAVIGAPITSSGKNIPVYGTAVGGLDGEFLMNGNILYEVMAPPQLSSLTDAYAVIISGDSMYPRYEDGELAFVDPSRRVKKGDYVVAQIQFEEHGPKLAFVKRFVRHNDKELVLSQLNPQKELTFPHENVASVHFIALAGIA